MLKILTVIYFVIILCSSNLSFANDGYEIIVKVNNKIISNHDIEKEKSYLSALNPKVLDIPENEMGIQDRDFQIASTWVPNVKKNSQKPRFHPHSINMSQRGVFTALNASEAGENWYQSVETRGEGRVGVRRHMRLNRWVRI